MNRFVGLILNHQFSLGVGVLGILLMFGAYCIIGYCALGITISALGLSILFIVWVDEYIDLILKYRKLFLLAAGVLGLGLAAGTYYIVDYFGLTNNIFKSSITILAFSLPIFFVLWLFRTHDAQESINNSTFFECARLLATKDSLCEKIALEQLAYLRRETSFDKKKIDSITKKLSLGNKEFSHTQLSSINLYLTDLKKTTLIKADLSNADLGLADLSNADLGLADLSNAYLGLADLSNADLCGANLSNADLRHAKLVGANLKPAESSNSDFSKPVDLSEADLRDADLRDADLTQAKLDGAKLEKALYNDKTIFTGTSFDSEEARKASGMKYQP